MQLFSNLKSKNSKSYDRINAYESNSQLFLDKALTWLKRSVHIGLILLIINTIASYFIYIDLKSNCYITLSAGLLELNNGSIVEGIKLIKKISPPDYENLCKNVKSISPNVGCGGIHGGCYYSSQPNKIYVNASKRDLVWNAEVIVHEVCHSMQANEGRTMSEEECYDENARIRKMIVKY